LPDWQEEAELTRALHVKILITAPKTNMDKDVNITAEGLGNVITSITSTQISINIKCVVIVGAEPPGIKYAIMRKTLITMDMMHMCMAIKKILIHRVVQNYASKTRIADIGLSDHQTENAI